MKWCILLLIYASNAFAHGHWPQKVEPRYIFTQVYELEFTLTNHFADKECFDIEINGKIYTPYSTCLAAGRSKKMKVWVPSQPDVKTTNKVCSVARNKGSIKTRMCTTATTMFAYSKLKGNQ